MSLNHQATLSPAFLLLVCLLPPAVAPTVAAEDRDALSLHGTHRFAVGDDPSWADPQFDDSAWSEIVTPGGWINQGFADHPYIGWYRIRFDLEGRTYQRPGLAVGNVRASYEVYLNGTLIASAGGIGDYGFWAPLLMRPRVFAFTNDVLRAEGENVLALRVQRVVADGGLRGGPLELGEGPTLRLKYERNLPLIFAWEAAFLTFYGSTLLFSGILWLLGFRDKSHFWFIVVILHIGFSHLSESALLDAAGGGSFWTSRLIYVLEQSFPAPTLMFLRHALGVRPKSWLYAAFGIYAVLCVAWWINIDTLNHLYWWWSLLAMAFAPVGFSWCLVGVRRRVANALPLLIGCVGLFLVLLYFTVAAIVAFSQDREFAYRANLAPLDWYAWLCLHISMIYTLAAGYERNRRRLRQRSQEILIAHEEERDRVASELYDGVGELLASVKSKLQSLSQQSQADDKDYAHQVKQSAIETDRVLDELQRVAADLRPEALLRDGLVVSIRELAARVFEQTSCQVTVIADATVNKNPPGADHLYRVVQEAINNAIRHGQATNIQVRIVLRERTILIDVMDDGVGFDTKHSAQDGRHLGLATMRERIEILRGKLSIESRPGKGTRVSVELIQA